MDSSHQPIPVIFYRENPSGNEPVREWLSEMDKESRKEIGRDIRMALGNAFGEKSREWPLGNSFAYSQGDRSSAFQDD